MIAARPVAKDRLVELQPKHHEGTVVAGLTLLEMPQIEAEDLAHALVGYARRGMRDETMVV